MCISAEDRARLDSLLPVHDVVFKLIMGDPTHTEKLIHFLNCLQVSKDPVVSVEILNSELTPENLLLKGFRLDIKAKTDKNETVIIEMQNSTQKEMVARVLDYWADNFSNQLKSGEGYSKLKRVVSITMANFELFPDDNRFWRKCHLRDDETNEIVTDLLEFQFVELPKMDKIDDNEPLTYWIEFLKNPYSKESEEICEKVPAIKEAKNMYEKAKADPKTLELIKARERAQLEVDSAIADAREEGIEKGKFEMARNLLKEGIQATIISAASGLSIDQIKSLQI